MSKIKNGQKKVKIFLVFLLIMAILLLAASCVGAFFSHAPEMSSDNPFGESAAVEKQPNTLVRFWNNIVAVFDSGTADDESTPNDEENGDSDNSVENSGGENVGDEDEPYEEKAVRKQGFYNFLLIARDAAGGNTDVIMVLSFDTEKDNISILQIPRDTYVNVPYSFKKINSVYAAGVNSARREGKNAEERELAGVEALKQTILTNFGIVIDRYVFVDIKGFRAIVNSVGGVDVYVQHDMVYKDPYQDLEIYLPKGQHHLDGEKAEGFVRYRSGYVNADIGRMDAQKIFMSAFLKKLFSVTTVAKIPELASHIMKYLDTDISVSDAVVFGKQLFEVDLSNITMHNVLGEALYHEGGAYFSLYEKPNIDLVNKYFNAFDKDLNADNVDAIELAPVPAGFVYDDSSSSAEDINKDNPNLIYLR